MKGIILIILTLINVHGISQSTSVHRNINLKSLDSYFGDVPLQLSFEKWFEYIESHPGLGIDSINERGAYSSFKNKTTKFPFPDSILVKALFHKTIYVDTLTKKSVDSTWDIAFEGVFGNDKVAKKSSISFYKQLRKQLKKNYWEEAFAGGRFNSLFKKGKSENFPTCQLYQDYSEELKFYFVMIYFNTQWLKKQ